MDVAKVCLTKAEVEAQSHFLLPLALWDPLVEPPDSMEQFEKPALAPHLSIQGKGGNADKVFQNLPPHTSLPM